MDKHRVHASDSPHAAPEKIELTSRGKLLSHVSTAVGLIGLGAWYLAAKALGILDWAVSIAPQEYAGAGLMVAIMLVMTPGLFLWNQFQRWSLNKIQQGHGAE